MKEYRQKSCPSHRRTAFLSVHLFGRVYFPFLFQKVTVRCLTAATEDLDLPGGGIFSIGKSNPACLILLRYCAAVGGYAINAATFCPVGAGRTISALTSVLAAARTGMMATMLMLNRLTLMCRLLEVRRHSSAVRPMVKKEKSICICLTRSCQRSWSVRSSTNLPTVILNSLHSGQKKGQRDCCCCQQKAFAKFHWFFSSL